VAALPQLVARLQAEGGGGGGGGGAVLDARALDELGRELAQLLGPLPDKLAGSLLPAMLQQAFAAFGEQQARQAGQAAQLQADWSASAPLPQAPGAEPAMELELLQLLAGLSVSGAQGVPASPLAALPELPARGREEKGAAPPRQQQQPGQQAQASAPLPLQQPLPETQTAMPAPASRRGLAPPPLPPGCGDALYAACPCRAQGPTGCAPLHLLDSLVGARGCRRRCRFLCRLPPLPPPPLPMPAATAAAGPTPPLPRAAALTSRGAAAASALQLSGQINGALDAYDAGGRTALHVAAAAGRADVVEGLLAVGCDANRPLRAHSLAAGGGPAAQQRSGEAQQQQRQEAKVPLQGGPQGSREGGAGAELPPQEWQVEALAGAGAGGEGLSAPQPLAPTSLSGCTPLHLAAHFGQLAALEVLLSAAGCDAEARSAQGCTPLHLAAAGGHAAAVARLCRAPGGCLPACLCSVLCAWPGGLAQVPAPAVA
jgi:hypothetical protein